MAPYLESFYLLDRKMEREKSSVMYPREDTNLVVGVDCRFILSNCQSRLKYIPASRGTVSSLQQQGLYLVGLPGLWYAYAYSARIQNKKLVALCAR